MEEQKKRKGRPRKSLLDVAAELPPIDMVELESRFREENMSMGQELERELLRSKIDLGSGAVKKLSEQDVKEINHNFEKLSYAQVEALGKVCRTDKMLDEMVAATVPAVFISALKRLICCRKNLITNQEI